MKKILRRENGITLVALVITVILMLILAGVAISALTTDGNLFSKTQSAVEKYNNAVKVQDEKIATLINEMNDYFNTYSEDEVGDNPVEEVKVVDFTYKPETQRYVVAKDGKYKIELWGAEGGHFSKNAASANKCKGAYTSGEIYLSKGTELFIYTGEAGIVSSDVSSKRTRITTYNGGGAGEIETSAHSAGYSGGGATDIRLEALSNDNSNEFSSLKSRIMVAAGGGGGAGVGTGGSEIYYSAGSSAAGGLTGKIGTYYSGHSNSNQYGKGGTQTSGGAVGTATYSATLSSEDKILGTGAFGKGGSGSTTHRSTGVGTGGGRWRIFRWRSWWTCKHWG